MSEDQADYVTDALEMIGTGYDPAAVIEQPTRRLVLREGLGEEWTVAWVKLSTAFKPHIKELRGAPLAVWLFISLSINNKGVAFPGIRTIAEDTGYSHQGVLDAIKTLEEKGYLTVRRGERKFNIYEPEFAAIGRTNEPSGTVNLLDSTDLSQVFDPDESTFSPNESSPLDLNKSNKSKQEPLTEKEIQQVNQKVDSILDMANFKGAKQEARVNAILSYLGETFHKNTETKEWRDFAKYIDGEKWSKGRDVKDFVKWLYSQKNFDLQYWPVKKMYENYPAAFVKEVQEPQYKPLPEDKNVYVPNPNHR